MAFVLPALLALTLSPLAIRLAWSTGYLDQPAARKLHTAATPLLGGVVVVVAALLGGAMVVRALPPGGGVSAHSGAWLLAGGLVALAWGLWDDRFGMGVAVKLAGQLLAASMLLAAGGTPNLGLPVALEGALVLFVMVSLMNAVNFLDNMNGMVGGIGAVTLLGYAAHSLMRGAWALAAVQLALAGASTGFLFWNFPKARIFLGDAGSLVLGYSLGASAVLAFAATAPGWGRVGPLFGLVYPAFDLIFVVVNRIREGRKVSQGGKDHSNHRLARVISCPKRTVILLWCSTAALCASGLVVRSLDRPGPTLLSLGLWMALCLWMALRLSSVPSGSPSSSTKS